MRLFLLLIPLLVATCSKESVTPMQSPGSPAPPPAPEADTTISYLALGDSYTIGTSVEEDERWPYQLSIALAERQGIAVAPLTYVARNGWRTDNLANALESDPPASDFDLVSLLIGVNDQYQGFNAEGYAGRFEGLLRRAIGFAGGDSSKVFVVSIPDYAYTPFGQGDERISRELDAFNATAERICQRYRIPFYNITPISRRAQDDPALVAGDGLHPSGKQYGLWVDEVLLQPVADLIRYGG